MMGGYLREVEKKHKLAGILCNIKDMGEGVKQNEHSKNHMVRRCLALLFPLAPPSDPMSYLVLLDLDVGVPRVVDKTLKPLSSG